MAKENKIEELPWYIEHYAEQLDRPATDFCDGEAMEFYRDFLPLYVKYAGTKSLMKHLRNYIDTHEIKRKDDFRFQLVSMWCFHIQYYRERNGIPFKPEDIFKIRIPKEILSIQ
jgi:hypothetical protein